jgi:hypothetical protein
MGYKLTNVSTEGVIEKGWYQGREAKVLHQRVSVTDDAKQITLGKKLPPRSRIVWANVVNHTAVAVNGNDGTNTANSYGLFNFGTATGPATDTASNATASAIVTAATNNLSASGVTRKAVGASTNDASAVYHNTSTNENTLALLPMFSNAARIYPKSDGFLFNGTAEVDVTLYIETYEDRYVKIH